MKQEDYELIQDFLRNDITAEKRAVVLERLKIDTDFSSAFYLEQQQFETFDVSSWSFITNSNSKEVDTYEAIFKSEKTQRLKAQIEEASRQYKTEESGPNKKWIFYSIAAMLAICFTVYSVFSTSSSPEKLFASNFDTNELPGLTVRGTNEDSLLLKAEALYNDKKYVEAIPLLDESIALQPKNLNILYLYKGVSHMQLDETMLAESTFNTLIESNLLDAQKGYWYKALLYLKTNQLEKTKTILQKISSENYYNKEKATTLLKELE